MSSPTSADASPACVIDAPIRIAEILSTYRGHPRPAGWVLDLPGRAAAGRGVGRSLLRTHDRAVPAAEGGGERRGGVSPRGESDGARSLLALLQRLVSKGPRLL